MENQTKFVLSSQIGFLIVAYHVLLCYVPFMYSKNITIWFFFNANEMKIS